MRQAGGVWVAGAFTVAGCIVGAVVSLVQAPEYRAATTVLVESHGAPATVPTVAALAVGDTVVGNLAAAVHADPGTIRSHLHVHLVPGTALVRLTYDDANRGRALQVVQQEATVVQAVVASRLGAATRVTIADPATAERLGRPVGRDVLLGGAIGLVLGLAAAGLLRRRPGRPPAPAPPAPGAETTNPPLEELTAEPAEPSSAAAPEPPGPGQVAELRALVAEHGAEFSADQVAEWNGYLEALAAQEVDGELPANLGGLVQDVFAPLLERP